MEDILGQLAERYTWYQGKCLWTTYNDNIIIPRCGTKHISSFLATKAHWNLTWKKYVFNWSILLVMHFLVVDSSNFGPQKSYRQVPARCPWTPPNPAGGPGGWARRERWERCPATFPGVPNVINSLGKYKLKTDDPFLLMFLFNLISLICVGQKLMFTSLNGWSKSAKVWCRAVFRGSFAKRSFAGPVVKSPCARHTHFLGGKCGEVLVVWEKWSLQI